MNSDGESLCFFLCLMTCWFVCLFDVCGSIGCIGSNGTTSGGSDGCFGCVDDKRNMNTNYE